MSVAEVPVENMAPTSDKSTTTVSTIAVQSGGTKLVLALLQCVERVELKIQEMVPLFTDIGSNLEEATQLCQQHDSVMEKLQGKQNPVEELLKQADETISRQKPKQEVYQAMADNLGLAWRDLNNQLEQRKLVLHQAVMFHRTARTLLEKLTRAEMEFGNSFIPHDVQKCQQLLDQLRATRLALSTCSDQLSSESDLLLDFIRPIAERSLGDSRPEYMRQAAERTLKEVADYREFLQGKLAEVEVIFSQREFMLSGSCRKRELEGNLRQLEEWYRSVGKKILDETSLGRDFESTEVLLKRNSESLETVKTHRQTAVKLLKSTEDSSPAGSFTGAELQQRAYLILSDLTSLEESVQTRCDHLTRTKDFFRRVDDLQATNPTTDPNTNPSHDKVKNLLIKDGQDLVKFYEVEPRAVAGIKAALDKLKTKENTPAGEQSPSASTTKSSSSTELKQIRQTQSTRTDRHETKMESRTSSNERMTSFSGRPGQESGAAGTASGEGKSLSNSSTESDLYEEITPRPLLEEQVSADVLSKVAKCEQSLVRESTKQERSHIDELSSPRQLTTASASRTESVLKQQKNEAYSHTRTAQKEMHFTEEKITATTNSRQEVKSEIRVTKQTTQMSTVIADNGAVKSQTSQQQAIMDQAFVIQRSPSFINFSSKINSIAKWLHEVLDAFLRENTDVGADLAAAKKFYQEHSRLQNELKTKEMDAMAAFSTLPAVLSLGGDDAAEAQKHGQKLRDDWERIGNVLELRARLAQRYVNFLKLSDQLSSDMTEVEETVGRPRTELSEAEQKDLLQSWMNAQQAIVQFNHQAKIIQDDAKRMKDPYLNVEALVNSVQAVQANLSTRRDILKKIFDVWEDRKEPPVAPPKPTQAEQLMKETQRTKESALKLEKELFPTIPRELNRAESIRRYLDRHIDTLMPLVRTIQSELEVRLRSIDHSLLKAQDDAEKKELVKVRDVLDTALSRLITKMSDYETIVKPLAVFLGNVEQMEKTAELVEKLGKDPASCSSDFREGPQSLEELSSTLQSHQARALEQFVVLTQESTRLAELVDQIEPTGAAARDKEKISRLLENTKQHFDNAFSQRRVSLAESKKLSDFNSNIQMLNQQIDRLSEDLSSLRSTFGDNLTAARTAQASFSNFEDTVKCLERQINEFLDLSTRLISDRRLDTRQVKSEVGSLQFKWNAFTRLVQDNRKLVDIAVHYFSVLDETEKWYRETNDYLVRVNQMCSYAQRDEKEALLNEVQGRIHSSQLDQEERLKRLISLGQQLYQGRVPPNAERVIQETRTVLETLQLLVAQLRKQSMQASLLHFQQSTGPNRPQKPVKSQSYCAPSKPSGHLVPAAHHETSACSLFESSQESSTRTSFTSVREQSRSVRETQELCGTLPVRSIQSSMQSFRCDESTSSTFTSNPVSQQSFGKFPVSAGFSASVAGPAGERGLQTFPIRKTASESSRSFSSVSRVAPQSSSSYPFFVVPLEDVETPELRRVTLRCVVQAFPSPKISWYKDGSMVRPGDFVSCSFDQDTGECMLCLQEAFVTDSGLYSCKAVNSSGLAETKARLLVRGERFRVKLY